MVSHRKIIGVLFILLMWACPVLSEHTSPTRLIGDLTKDELCKRYTTDIENNVQTASRYQCAFEARKFWSIESLEEHHIQCLSWSDEKINKQIGKLFKDFFIQVTFADEEVKKSELCLWRDMVYSTVQAKVLLSESVYLQQTLGSVQKDKDFVVIPKEIRQHIIAEEADVPFVKLNPERRIYPERSDCLFLGTPLNLDFNDKTEEWLVSTNDACWNRVQLEQYWSWRFWLVQANEGNYRTLLADEGSRVKVYRTETDGFMDIRTDDSVQQTFGNGKQFRYTVARYLREVEKRGRIDAIATQHFQYDKERGRYYNPFEYLSVW